MVLGSSMYTSSENTRQLRKKETMLRFLNYEITQKQNGASLNATRMVFKEKFKTEVQGDKQGCIKLFHPIIWQVSNFLRKLFVIVCQSYHSICQNVLWLYFLCFTHWSPNQIMSPGWPQFTKLRVALNCWSFGLHLSTAGIYRCVSPSILLTSLPWVPGTLKQSTSS